MNVKNATPTKQRAYYLKLFVGQTMTKQIIGCERAPWDAAHLFTGAFTTSPTSPTSPTPLLSQPPVHHQHHHYHQS